MPTIVQQVLYGVLTFFVALFIVSCLFLHAAYIYSVYADNPLLEKQQLDVFLPLLLVLLLLGVSLYRLSLTLNRYRPLVVMPVVLIVSFLIQLAIIVVFPRLPTDDSQVLLSLAFQMLNADDYSTFAPGGYLHMFPFNFSLVLYFELLLALLPNTFLTIKVFNIFFMLLTTVVTYLIYEQLRSPRHSRDYGVLIFGATYIPALFMNNLIYNDVISTALLTSALYWAIRFMSERRMVDVAVAAVLLALGNYLRGIGAVFLIAIVIAMLLKLRSIGVTKVLASACIIGVLFSTPGLMQSALLQATGKVSASERDNAAPIYLWLNMGMNLKRFGYWDNMESYQMYFDSGYSRATSAELYKQAIAQKLSTASLWELAEMYYKKLIWMWTEGTYQMERYGIGADDRAPARQPGMGIVTGYSYTNSITELFAGNSPYRIGLLWIAYTVNILMYCFLLVHLIGSIWAKQFEGVALVLVLLGFIAVYLLWEIKSRYLFPAYPLLIVLSYMGFRDVYYWAQQKKGLKWLGASESRTGLARVTLRHLKLPGSDGAAPVISTGDEDDIE